MDGPIEEPQQQQRDPRVEEDDNESIDFVQIDQSAKEKHADQEEDHDQKHQHLVEGGELERNLKNWSFDSTMDSSAGTQSAADAENVNLRMAALTAKNQVLEEQLKNAQLQAQIVENGVTAKFEVLKEKNKTLESQLEKVELREKALEKKLEEKDKQIAILLTRMDELNQLKELCQMVQSKIDQQQPEEVEKAKEVEKPASEENTPKCKSSLMTSNSPNHRDQLSELALKKLNEWPYEKPVQTITTNVRHFLSRVSSHQLNFQLRKSNAEGSTSSSNNYNLPAAAGDSQKSKDVLLESVQIEKAILRSRMDQLDELEKLCQMVHREIDQQKREEQIIITVWWYELSKRFNVTMNSVEDNVLALKVAIRNYTNIKLEQIRLLYGNNGNLEDCRTLAHYNIDHGCTVILTKCNCGC